jgi:MinD-like ATPase involved in chromosome partitioning or flagellar assembly
MKPFWVTFYSYKGGVGRSLALANIAALLVKQGRRVVLVDFDLEAPGLDSFSEFSKSAGKPGVVEYVSEFIRTTKAPNIISFVHQCELPYPVRGKLSVMPAGRKDAAYNHQLTHINWTELYEKQYGAAFFENWKAAIEKQYQPDYVFVDSRTGLTEIGGVCTTQFPDLVIMLFALNEQNIQGTATVARSIQKANPEKAAHIHFIASPVPNLPPEPKGKYATRRQDMLSERIESAGKILGTNIKSQIHYFSLASLSEKLFVLDTELSKQFFIGDLKGIRDYITDLNYNGIDYLLKQSKKAINDRDLEKINSLGFILKRDFNDRAETLATLARFAFVQNNSDEAIELFERALSLDPTFDKASDLLLYMYDRENKSQDIIRVLSIILKQKTSLEPERLIQIHSQLGQIYMRIEHYSEAEKQFQECLVDSSNHKDPLLLMLRHYFNKAEARRRAYKEIRKEDWSEVVKVFVESGNLADMPIPEQANKFQAMHLAYACLGDISTAKDFLKKASALGKSVGEIEKVFSAKSYTYISSTEFLNTNQEMEQALDRGELWDGMKLPLKIKAY